MRSANEARGATRSRVGPAVAATLVVGAGAAGVALWKSGPVGAFASEAELVAKLEEDWRSTFSKWDFEFAIVGFEASEAGKLVEAEAGDELVLPWLPAAFEGESFAATTKSCVTQDGVTTWRGTLKEPLFGYTLLVVSDAGVAGLVQRDDTIYTIEPLPHEKMVIAEIFPHELPKKHPVPRPPADAADARAVAAAFGKSAEPEFPIELLLLLPETSPRAPSYCEGPTKALVERMFEARFFDAYNTTFDEALATDVTFNVTLEEVPYVPEGGTFGKELEWLQSDPTVETLRNAANADLVGLLVDVPKTRARIGGVTDGIVVRPEHWFFAVEIHSALAHYSAEHEVGHCMGMHHDVGEGGPAHCNYGHMMLRHGADPQELLVGRTIMMANHGSGMPRVPVFSHPATDEAGVSYGLPCGTSDAADPGDPLSKYYTAPSNNRRMILENAATISRYKQGHPADG